MLKSDDPKVTLLSLKNGDAAGFLVKGSTVDDVEIDKHWNFTANRPLTGDEINQVTDREGLWHKAYEKQFGKKPGKSQRTEGIEVAWAPVQHKKIALTKVAEDLKD